MENGASKFSALTANRFRESKYWNELPSSYHRIFDVGVEVLPFRVNNFVLENLIDWSSPLDDPMFRLLFPQPGMLTERQFCEVEEGLSRGTTELRSVVAAVRSELNPHPAGQITENIPSIGNEVVNGVQHKYAETALFFPSAGQTCHAYCSFCFRWPQFIGDNALKIQARETEQMVSYLKEHPEITDVLITGGDPLIMNAKTLKRYLDAFLSIPTISTIRLGTKSLSYWPHRFLSDGDTPELLALLKSVNEAGKHLAVMAHINHWRELEPLPVRNAIEAVKSTGAFIRTQAPLLKNINDDSETWARLWRESVKLGVSPYYMFVERDTGPSRYFQVPLVDAHAIYSGAIRQISGLARTARGPVMSSHPGKIVLDGIVEVAGGKALSLRFLQARNSEYVGRSFLAEYDAAACWIDELKPFGASSFFFEEDQSLKIAS